MRAPLLMLILPFLAACRSVCAPQEVQAMHGPASCCGGLRGPLRRPGTTTRTRCTGMARSAAGSTDHAVPNSCVGDDCADLYRSMSGCEQAHVNCR